MRPITHPTKPTVPPKGMRTGVRDAFSPAIRGWVLYDADCAICTRFALRYEKLLARRNFAILPLQDAWIRERFKDLDDATYLAEMRLLYTNGKKFGGADALIELARHYWWAWPLFALGHIPPFHALMRAGYRWFARNRDCVTHGCEIHTTKRAPLTIIDFLPLLVLPAIAACFRTLLAPWVLGCVMPTAIFAGFKWLTYREAALRLKTKNTFRTLGYLFAWPGMDAAKFLSKETVPAKPRVLEWSFAITKTIFGILLVWGGARFALPDRPLLAGWIAVVGIIFILHFGLFHILSVAWRAIGIEARPFMDNPFAATSLAEFWGRRWNTAFNFLAFRYAFQPLRRITRPVIATLIVFLLSGLVHDLVLSVPANSGYGLPTIYFLIQGLGLVVERTTFARRLGFGHGVRGWFFVAIVTAGPLFILVSPIYIKTVILPMLHVIGAT